jgi:hypothetical protein
MQQALEKIILSTATVDASIKSTIEPTFRSY